MTPEQQAIADESKLIMARTDWCPGSLMTIRPDGSLWVCSPGELLFSSATMCASHYWSVTELKWLPIHSDE